MAECSYSLRPLHSIPDLIPACVKILKQEWPLCKAELLPEIANKERTGSVPCSFGLVQHAHDKDDVLVGHLRLIPVTNRERAAYCESLCVDKEMRGRSLGSMILRKGGELLTRLGYRELHLGAHYRRRDYYCRQSFLVHDEPVHTIGANLLHTYRPVDTGPCFVSWHGNVLYPGWESEYEGGPIATEKEVADGGAGMWFVKYLNC